MKIGKAGAIFAAAAAIAVGAWGGEPQSGDTAGKPNLAPNGDFEKGQVTPDGWQSVDGLSSFWVEDGDPTHGKAIKFNTDILQSQAYEWWARIRAGASPADAPPPRPTVEPKYDTLAGLDGTWYWSDSIPIEQGKAYWLTIDGKGAEMMAWLVGYTNKPDTRFGADAAAFMGYLRDGPNHTNSVRNHKGFIHEYEWKGQLKVGGSPEWKTYSRREKPFRPTEIFPDIRYVRIVVMPYWPPGLYYIDNVRLTEYAEPKQ